MQTKILEATATLNNKKINIINTQMDIMCDWDIELHRNSASVDVNIIVHQVAGNFMWADKQENYTKEVSISFETTKEWKLSGQHYASNLRIEPISTIIDFDKKSVVVLF
jgi:hypothetical protein